MAAMEQALCSWLLTQSEVTSLIGSGNSARLWADVLPQTYTVAAGPAVTYEIVFSDEEHLLSERAGLVESRVRIVAYGATRTSANALARAIKNCGIDAFKGVYADVDIRGVSIDRGLINDVEVPTDGSGEHRYLAEFDFKIDYLE